MAGDRSGAGRTRPRPQEQLTRLGYVVETAGDVLLGDGPVVFARALGEFDAERFTRAFEGIGLIGQRVREGREVEDVRAALSYRTWCRSSRRIRTNGCSTMRDSSSVVCPNEGSAVLVLPRLKGRMNSKPVDEPRISLPARCGRSSSSSRGAKGRSSR